MKQTAFDAFYRQSVEDLQPIQSRGSLRSQHASAMGAIRVQPKAAEQRATVYATYQDGPKSDAQVSALTGIQRSSVIPRRRELMKLGLVVEVGFVRNEHSGVSNTTYGAVEKAAKAS